VLQKLGSFHSNGDTALCEDHSLEGAKSHADAGYFARSLRAIEVLVDQDVVRSGLAATEPWKFYDLGHCYCTYDFFDQCQHRMACAKCDFYMPKDSTAALLLEGRTYLLRLLQEIPLGEAEQAAVEDGVAAYENLLSRLSDVPTPTGPTPRQLGAGLVQITSARPALPASTLTDSRSNGAGSRESQINSRNSRRVRAAVYSSRIAVTGFRRIARCAGR
jgi:hypothetical protein